MHWTGLILIDCWGGGWLDRCPKSADLYRRILDTLQHYSITVDTIIDAVYPIDGGFGPTPELDHIPCQHRRRDILDWGKFRSQGFNSGAWLIAGQSWAACIHQRRLGVISYVNDLQMRCQLYSHPRLLDHLPGQNRPVTDQDFAEDHRVTWQGRTHGFWRVYHPRHNRESWW